MAFATDNDAIYKDATLLEFYKANGIEFHPSPVYVKELNRAIERTHRTIGERVDTLYKPLRIFLYLCEHMHCVVLLKL